MSWHVMYYTDMIEICCYCCLIEMLPYFMVFLFLVRSVRSTLVFSLWTTDKNTGHRLDLFPVKFDKAEILIKQLNCMRRVREEGDWLQIIIRNTLITTTFPNSRIIIIALVVSRISVMSLDFQNLILTNNLPTDRSTDYKISIIFFLK